MDPNMDMSGMSMTPTPTPLDPASTLFLGVIFVVSNIIGTIFIIALWKVFTKAGQSGWKSIIPTYNYYIIIKIVGRSGWWLLASFVPLFNIIFGIVLALELGRAFGRSALFSIFLLAILSPIGYSIIGFGSSRYLGPHGADDISSNSSLQPAA